MPGPNSMPEGNKSRWMELNEIVCNVHFHCTMDSKLKHEYITYREWLSKRNKLRTGKTV